MHSRYTCALLLAVFALGSGAARGADPGEAVEVPWLPWNAPAFQMGAREERGARADRGQLPVRLYKPDGVGPFPFVVLLHGCGGLHREAMWKLWVQPWADLLRAHGVGAAVVDSFTPRGVDQVCTGDVAGWAVRRADDAHSVRAWLAAQPYVDAQRIAVMGMSNGGRTVLAALRATSARTDRFAAGIALYPGCQSDLESMFSSPLLVLIGRGDSVTPARYCEQMRLAPEVKLVVYPNGPHTFDMKLPDRTHFKMRLGYDADATADARRQVVEFLTARDLIRPRR